jgi:hypothetical protein
MPQKKTPRRSPAGASFLREQASGRFTGGALHISERMSIYAGDNFYPGRRISAVGNAS